MTLYTTYGYILIAQNIYDLKAFVDKNEQAIEAINELIINDPSGNLNLTFEYDNQYQVLIAFTVFGETAESKDETFNNTYKVIKSFFPSCKKIVKINVMDREDGKIYFNSHTYNYFYKGEGEF